MTKQLQLLPSGSRVALIGFSSAINLYHLKVANNLVQCEGFSGLQFLPSGSRSKEISEKLKTLFFLTIEECLTDLIEKILPSMVAHADPKPSAEQKRALGTSLEIAMEMVRLGLSKCLNSIFCSREHF